MLSILTLTVLFHLAPALPPPEDPPVYWPCPPHNPLTEYHLWTSTQWDPACFRTYMGTYLNAIHDYWAWVDGCAPGDCDCYAAAWAAFTAKMEEAENALRHCSLT